MRVWIEELPKPVYDADDIRGNTSFLLEEYIHKYVSRNKKIYYVADSSHFAFWINPVTKVTMIYNINDKKAIDIYYNSTKEKEDER